MQQCGQLRIDLVDDLRPENFFSVQTNQLLVDETPRHQGASKIAASAPAIVIQIGAALDCDVSSSAPEPTDGVRAGKLPARESKSSTEHEQCVAPINQLTTFEASP